MTGAPILKTKRLILSSFTEDDASSVFEYASNPEVARYVTWSHHQSLEDSKAFIQFSMGKTQTSGGGTYWNWAIRLPDRKAIGSIQFLEVSEAEGQIDFVLSKDHWRKGLMTEVITRVLEWGFSNHPKMSRVRAFCLVENIGSQKVQEKAGLKYEGLMRDYMEVKGQLHDLQLRAITRRDFIETSKRRS